jgi:predicted O-linked N-acetylglucosamine transferase (SPINDLY family)/predicted SAM-dependent methyltransferase
MTQPGRNDPCPCGSGKKYKKCHGAQAPAAAAASHITRSAEPLPDAQRLFESAVEMHRRGLFDEAQAVYQRMLAAYPNHPHLLHNLGLLDFERGHYAQAAERVQAALRAEPGRADFQASLGAILSAIGRPQDALAAFEGAGRPDADNPEAMANYAVALGQAGRLGDAIAAARQSLQRRPGHVETLSNLGNLLTDARRFAEAGTCYREALAQRVDAGKAHSNLLMMMNYDERVDAAALRDEHLRFGQLHGALWQALPQRHDNPPDAQRRVRLAYLSADFGDHAVGHLLRDVLWRHDRKAFEVFFYATRRRDDALAEAFRRSCDQWRDVAAASNDELEQRLRADGIDILVDLGGHTAGNRLGVLARKPAPLQFTYLGYTTTTGLPSIDYRLSDEIVDPPGSVPGPERTVALGRGLYRYTPPDGAPEVAPPPLQRLGTPTFGCSCNLSKLSPRAVALWSTLLCRLPQARLRLKAKALGDEAVRETLLREFESRGVARARIDWQGWTGHREHLAHYAQVDVTLDTLPFNLGVNSCESLWMGVPVVSRRADTPGGRIGASILDSAGCADWVADSDEAFVNTACALVSDAGALAALRAALRERLARSALLDGASLASELDAIYRRAWAAWCDRAAPQAGTPATTATVLHVGCGSPEAGRLPTRFAAPHWRELRLDIDERVKPDYVASITDMGMVPDALAEALYSSHNVEHLFPHEVTPALREFGRVLKPGGFVLIVVPDLQLAAERVLSGELNDPVYQSPAGPVTAHDMIYGQAESIGEGNLFMMHKTGFTAASLQQELERAGFHRVTVQRMAYALWAVGHKDAGRPQI